MTVMKGCVTLYVNSKQYRYRDSNWATNTTTFIAASRQVLHFSDHAILSGRSTCALPYRPWQRCPGCFSWHLRFTASPRSICDKRGTSGTN